MLKLYFLTLRRNNKNKYETDGVDHELSKDSWNVTYEFVKVNT